METPATVSFKGLDPSPALRELIDRHIANLEELYPRITTCRVVVEQPHHHHQHGHTWRIGVHLSLPGNVIVVDHEPKGGRRPEDAYAAVRDAFALVQRKLRGTADRKSGEVKHHEGPVVGAVLALGADHGFLSTGDGRQVYFHANAVLGGRFDDLRVGSAVGFVEEDGVDGPQASTVRPLG
jgi:cold shock CspA family protein/ribosome-associated translation inhibitor RaiA